MSRPVVEDGLRLHVHRAALAGKRHAAPFHWFWSNKATGEQIASINIAITFDSPSSGTMALTFRCNGAPMDQRFRLEAEPCRFGGVRWRAVCPATGARADKLYVLGDAGFQARRRYRRIAYRTQRASDAFDRMVMRRNRILFHKLKGDDPSFVPKPKWMRWKTYDRLQAQLMEAEAQLDDHLAGLMILA